MSSEQPPLASLEKNFRLEELDLAIPDMHNEQDEAKAAEALRDLPGVGSVRFVPRGAWVSYRSETISKEQICLALREAGFRASVFQDSKSGKVGETSY
jgi:hypothetical protein